MELQALRYAAMASTMTFVHVAQALAGCPRSKGEADHSEAKATQDLLDWLEADEDEEPVVKRDVGIVLASEDFSLEIPTTLLRLNEFHDFDIRCIRLSPYVIDDRVLLDVQPLLPLPEASQYTIRVREKEKLVRQTQTGLGPDLTKFVVPLTRVPACRCRSSGQCSSWSEGWPTPV
jgi:hypothetical protein